MSVRTLFVLASLAFAANASAAPLPCIGATFQGYSQWTTSYTQDGYCISVLHTVERYSCLNGVSMTNALENQFSSTKGPCGSIASGGGKGPADLDLNASDVLPDESTPIDELDLDAPVEDIDADTGLAS